MKIESRKIEIRGAIDAQGKSRALYIENGIIVEKFLSAENVLTLDAHGLTVLPGLVDLHTHLREPGREDAETVLTGSQAAVAGGYTAISAMPNTLPVEIGRAHV